MLISFQPGCFFYSQCWTKDEARFQEIVSLKQEIILKWQIFTHMH